MDGAYGYSVVNYDGLIREVKNAINGDARKYVVVFAHDVVPYELFSDDLDPMNSLIMRFIAKGGAVVWVGDIPFWSRTKRYSRGEREEIWNKALPFTAFGVFTVFSFSNIPPKAIIKIGNKEVSWASRRPIIYPPELRVEVEAKESYELKNVG